MKQLLLFFIACALTGAILTLSFRTSIRVTLVAVFYPVILPFMGRDAITSGTVCIFGLFLKYAYASFENRNFIKNRFDWVVYATLFFGGLSVAVPYLAGRIDADQMGRIIRQFFGFAGGLVFFNIIRNSCLEYAGRDEREAYLEQLLSIILVLMASHIVLSIIVKLFPSIGPVFNIFLGRTAETIDFGSDMERIRTIILGGEAYGEILAVMSPLVIYKIWRYRKVAWGICLLLFALGIVLSVTRSGIILFVISFFAFLAVFFKKYPMRASGFLLAAAAIPAILMLLRPDLMGNMITRLDQSLLVYRQTGDFFEAINRSFFPQVFQKVITNLTLFGAGIPTIRLEYGIVRHFHNLYMTLVFERGVIGGAFIMVILFYPMVQLVRRFRINLAEGHKQLMAACVIAMMVFFVNECKYEFTRHSSYQQICWSLVGLFYMVTSHSEMKKQSARNV
jgi:hypothetical protein